MDEQTNNPIPLVHPNSTVGDLNSATHPWAMSTLTYHGQFQSHILSTGTGTAAIGISVSDFLWLQNNNILQLGVINETFSGNLYVIIT